jgi:hypothetical protein
LSKKQKHSLPYRLWNQARLSKHAIGWFDIYDEFLSTPDGKAWPLALSITRGSILQALYQSLLVHLDMIDSHQGVSFRKLIGEVEQAGAVSATDASAMRMELDKKAHILKAIRMQRNNIVAHRSESLSFREVKTAFPITLDNLREMTGLYYSLAHDLHSKLPFQNPWKLDDTRSGVLAIKEAFLFEC